MRRALILITLFTLIAIGRPVSAAHLVDPPTVSALDAGNGQMTIFAITDIGVGSVIPYVGADGDRWGYPIPDENGQPTGMTQEGTSGFWQLTISAEPGWHFIDAQACTHGEGCVSNTTTAWVLVQ